MGMQGFGAENHEDANKYQVDSPTVLSQRLKKRSYCRQLRRENRREWTMLSKLSQQVLVFVDLCDHMCWSSLTSVIKHDKHLFIHNYKPKS